MADNNSNQINQGKPVEDEQPPINPLAIDNQFPFGHPRQARMAKFRSNIAQSGNKKTSEAYIDTGATHNFIHNRSAFISYSTIEPESVESASTTTQLIGKCSCFCR